MDSSFNGSYTDYWQERVSKLSDGTKIADSDIADLFLPFLDIQKDDILLDMGCSYGRFFHLLSKYSVNVIGIDIEAGAIKKASEYAYTQLETGSLEAMPFEDDSIDKAFCWATFDCTEQEQVLAETNRVLKPEGRFLVTGKNIRYAENDEVAFIAERNAKLKSFPNHFTDIEKLYNISASYGFEVEKGFAFRYRGDFGLAKGIPIDKDVLRTPFYEYILILQKIGTYDNIKTPVCDIFSATAREKSKEAGYSDPLQYFKDHKEKYGN
jgi:SAM-dependent methyltransferase